jgi:hypothetical protein
MDGKNRSLRANRQPDLDWGRDLQLGRRKNNTEFNCHGTMGTSNIEKVRGVDRERATCHQHRGVVQHRSKWQTEENRVRGWYDTNERQNVAHTEVDVSPILATCGQAKTTASLNKGIQGNIEVIGDAKRVVDNRENDRSAQPRRSVF